MSDGLTEASGELGRPQQENMQKFAKQKADYRAKVYEIVSSRVPLELLPSSYLKAAVDFYMSLPYLDFDAPIREDNVLVAITLPFILGLQYKKEGAYGRSWCKRGELDTFFNTARKFDRIENMMLNGAKDEVGEGKVDTVGDMASYGLLWMTFILREHPNEFFSWLNKNVLSN
jgi:hypothetical protein